MPPDRLPYIHKIIIVTVGRSFRESKLVFHASPLCHINRTISRICIGNQYIQTIRIIVSELYVERQSGIFARHCYCRRNKPSIHLTLKAIGRELCVTITTIVFPCHFLSPFRVTCSQPSNTISSLAVTDSKS